MRYFAIPFILLLIVFSACEPESIGFLNIDENAGYSVDSLVVYQDPPKTSNQYKYKSNYATTSVEGVEGTRPICYTIKSIEGDNNEGVERLKEIIDVKSGIGLIVIPCEHDLPIGRYNVSLQVKNIYGFALLKDALTVIVK